MDITAIILLIAAAIGSFWGGRRASSSEALTLLQAEIEILKTKNIEKDSLISELQGKLTVLEQLVTQKAEVSAVHVDVRAIHDIVERIASKVEA